MTLMTAVATLSQTRFPHSPYTGGDDDDNAGDDDGTAGDDGDDDSGRITKAV